jgi:CelD/BcsL family acetyltransferase involved in cellulose biosynthesis
VHFECSTEETFAALFRTFFLLHRARWTERGETGVLADAKLEQFHIDAARTFLLRKILRLYVLHINDSIAGAIYTFTHRRRA